MKLDKILKSASFSEAEKEAAERWYKMGTHKGQELQGSTIDETHEVLARLIKQYEVNQAKKKEKEDKVGSRKTVIALIDKMVRGYKEDGKTVKYTYKQIENIIKENLAKRNEGIDKIEKLQKEIEELKATYNI